MELRYPETLFIIPVFEYLGITILSMALAMSRIKKHVFFFFFFGGWKAYILGDMDMGVSKNRGTPKSSILIGFSLIFWGTPIFGNTNMEAIYTDTIQWFGDLGLGQWHSMAGEMETRSSEPVGNFHGEVIRLIVRFFIIYIPGFHFRKISRDEDGWST